VLYQPLHAFLKGIIREQYLYWHSLRGYSKERMPYYINNSHRIVKEYAFAIE
jgi:hypothetical protein